MTIYWKGTLMKRIMILSPYSGDIERNMRYLQRCIWHVIQERHAPFAPHYIYPSFMDDTNSLQRDIGIAMGLLWGSVSDELWLFQDYGISDGMATEVGHYQIDHPSIPLNVINIGKN